MEYYKGKKILIYYTVIYVVFNFFVRNFISLRVDESTLKGSAKFSINYLSYFNLSDIVSTVFFIVTAYYLLKKYKWAEGVMVGFSLIDAFTSLLVIETSNFSMYNVILVISIILSVTYVYILCRLKSVRIYLKGKE